MLALEREQVRDIGARDEEEQANGAHEHPDVARNRAWECLLEREQPHAPLIGELCWFACLQIRDDWGQVHGRLGLCHARFQPREQVYVRDPLDDSPSLESDRQVDVGAAPHEPLRHHADDGTHGVVQPHAAPYHRWIAAELALPELIAEHRDRFGARLSVARRRCSAQERGNPHDVERVERAMVATKALRVPVAGPDDVADRRGDDTVEDAASLGDLDELIDGVREAPPTLRRVPHHDARQVVDVLVRERIEHDGIQHAVDGRRGHDAERQRADREHRERRRLRQASHAHLKIAPGVFNPIHGGETTWVSGSER
jgi:hypothetical protein